VQAGGGRVSWGSEASWGESTITWDNAPAIGSLVWSLPNSTKDGTIGANVTAPVNSDADGLMTFALTTTATGQASYHSGEDGQPPRIVLTVSCAGGGPPGQPDSDGDGVADLCDCAPADASVLSAPSDIDGLRWSSKTGVVWLSDASRSGTATRYDVLVGDLSAVGVLHASAGDLCIGDDLSSTQVIDGTPDPATGTGRFYLVRGDNACGKGRYEVTSDGRDRLATACP
jgi:hypothetical protein